MSTPVQIPIHVVDSSSPVFPDQQTEVRIPENMAMHSPVLSIQAVSPKGQKLIYSIFDGDKYGDFAVDFNTGTFLCIFVCINVCVQMCVWVVIYACIWNGSECPCTRLIISY